jgi:ArsR family metal-binding transcriptional regulator
MNSIEHPGDRLCPYIAFVGSLREPWQFSLIARVPIRHLTIRGEDQRCTGSWPNAQQIAIGNVEDYDVAVAELGELIGLINRTWERRAEITPVFETRQRPSLMTAYRLLPQTNCQECGEPTCYAFAIKLVATQKTMADCPPLFEPIHAEKRVALQGLIGAASAMG